MNPTLNTIDIMVSDMQAAIAFHGHLGLEFKLDEYLPSTPAAICPAGCTSCSTPRGFRTPFLPGWTAPTGGPRTLLCFESESAAGVDAQYAELGAARYRGLAEPFDACWGMRYATVTDPDGNGVDLYAALPAG